MEKMTSKLIRLDYAWSVRIMNTTTLLSQCGGADTLLLW